MLNASEKIVIGKDNPLYESISLIGGEPRARHIYVKAGALNEIKSTYQEFLGERATIVSKDEAVALGYFGTEVSEDSLDRIGDLIVIAKGGLILIDPDRFKQESGMVGHHGGLDEIESIIPLLAY